MFLLSAIIYLRLLATACWAFLCLISWPAPKLGHTCNVSLWTPFSTSSEPEISHELLSNMYFTNGEDLWTVLRRKRFRVSAIYVSTFNTKLLVLQYFKGFTWLCFQYFYDCPVLREVECSQLLSVNFDSFVKMTAMKPLIGSQWNTVLPVAMDVRFTKWRQGSST